MRPLAYPRFFVVLSLVTVAGFWGGCHANTYAVKVDAVAKRDPAAAPAAEPQSYKIKSKNPALGEEDLRYLEAADYVKTALSGRGLYEAPSDDKADMIVELDYGIEAPRTKIEMVSVPRYGQVGGGVRYEQLPVVDQRGNTSYRTVAIYQPPRTELLGYDERPERVTVYEKYLRVTARENKPGVEGRPPSQIWSVQTSTEDQSKDIRKYLPIMASATADSIGKDTGTQKVIKIRDDSQAVDFIRKGMENRSLAPVEQPKI